MSQLLAVGFFRSKRVYAGLFQNRGQLGEQAYFSLKMHDKNPVSGSS